MQNIILKGMLREFAVRNGLEQEGEDLQFEKFCNYCILSNDHYDSFGFDKVSTGQAQGVDGVAIVIGDLIIDQIEDANHYTQTQFSVTFHFVQAKTSQSFSLGDFLKFTSIVRAFFGSDRDALPEELRNAFDIKEVIYQRAGKLSTLPKLMLWYGYTGEFKVDGGPARAAIDSEVDVLKNEKYKFSDVSLAICDGVMLSDMYREAQNNTVGRISFQRHVALPKINGATAAYIGVIRCKDYVDLVKKASGEINKGLFYENVRDFLGATNPVNRDIGETINSSSSRDQFALLNNGVTIVAKKVVPSGDFFDLHRFQVVNGCQTSHVLFNSETNITPEMYLTVKLIETDDVDLTNSIIRSTNSQSQVMKEAFATIRPYHRVLEDYFSAMRVDGFKFYYERRPHQYDDLPSVTQDQIVSVPNLMKSFVSVVLEEPHKVHYYYGRLLEEYNNRQELSELFSEDDYPGLYFVSHVITSRVRGKVAKDSSLKPWVYHISLLIKNELAPELVRGTAFRDKSFQAILARVTGGIDTAFEKAKRHIKSKKRSLHDNRLPPVTAEIVRSFFGSSVSIQIQPDRVEVTAKRDLAAVGVPADPDGDYVGRFESVNGTDWVVRYGSRVFLVPRSDGGVADPQMGQLVRFTRLSGRICDSVLI